MLGHSSQLSLVRFRFLLSLPFILFSLLPRFISGTCQSGLKKIVCIKSLLVIFNATMSGYRNFYPFFGNIALCFLLNPLFNTLQLGRKESYFQIISFAKELKLKCCSMRKIYQKLYFYKNWIQSLSEKLLLKNLQS